MKYIRNLLLFGLLIAFLFFLLLDLSIILLKVIVTAIMAAIPFIAIVGGGYLLLKVLASFHKPSNHVVRREKDIN